MIGQLTDAGNTTTLAHYLELLQGAGMLAGLAKYSHGQVRQRGSSPKLQVLNTALMTAQDQRSFSEARHDGDYWGRLVESCIGAHLVNSSFGTDISVTYWRERNHEVDFIFTKGEDSGGDRSQKRCPTRIAARHGGLCSAIQAPSSITGWWTRHSVGTISVRTSGPLGFKITDMVHRIIASRKQRAWVTTPSAIQQLSRSARQLARSSVARIQQPMAAERLTQFLQLTSVENACKLMRADLLVQLIDENGLRAIDIARATRLRQSDLSEMYVTAKTFPLATAARPSRTNRRKTRRGKMRP